MKKFKFIALAALAALSLGACSDKELDGPGANGGFDNPNKEDGVYFTINIDLPTVDGSRSHTINPPEGVSGASDSGVEIGQKYENTVTSAIIVLAEAKTNNFIAAAYVNKATPIGNGEDHTAYTVTSTFTKTQLANYYENKNETVNEANIFVFCNPTTTLINKIFGSSASAAAVVLPEVAQNSNS